LEKYTEYLIHDDEEKWYNKLKQVSAYMDKEKKRPSTYNENPDIKILGRWVHKQKDNYKNNKNMMASNPAVRVAWETTLEKYTDYLSDPDQLWYNKLKKVCAYMDKEKKRPSSKNENPDIKYLGEWVQTQKDNYKNNVGTVSSNPAVRAAWETTLEKYTEYLIHDDEEKWYNNLKKVCAYMDKEKKQPPSTRNKNPDIKKLGEWINSQKQNYKNTVGTVSSNPAVRAAWETALEKYAEYLKQSIIPLPTQPVEPQPPKPRTKKQKALPVAATASTTTSEQTKTTIPHHFPPPSDIGLLHKNYLRMSSDTLHEMFKANPQLWREYHDIRKQTFAKYDPASIPSNRIIQELEKIQTKRPIPIADMGCGEAPIAHHFKNDRRFTCQSYDHHSYGDPLIQEVDISALPLEDASVAIAIMSLALWGTQENCNQYIKEAFRVLESGGKFYISDSTKKWSPEPLTPANGGELLRTMLIANGFKIITEDIGLPFCLFVCMKMY
jgi:hypothetical protein